MSSIVQCSPSDLKRMGVTVTVYYAGEIQQLAANFKGKPFLHIIHEDDGQELTIPVPELEQLSQSISHLGPQQEILLIYQAHSGVCIFQYTDAHGNAATVHITNQLLFKPPALAN
jgi:hypothetical protein